MKFSVFIAQCACVLAIAAAQDVDMNGQAGSMMADISLPPASDTDPGMAAPAGVDVVIPSPPVVVTPATQTPDPVRASTPVSLTDSGSGSFGSANDIEAPATMKSKKAKDSSRSQSNSPIPSEDSSSPTTAALPSILMALLVLGLAAML